MNELNCRATTGATVTAIPYLLGVAQTPIALTEIGTTGRYTGHMTGEAGIYQFDFTENGVVIGTGEIEWNGTAEVTIATRLATTGYTAPDNAGIAAIPTNPLLTTDIRLDNLDTTISSRLAGSAYAAPDNVGITAIKAKTDNLPASPASAGEYTAGIAAIPLTPLLAADYVAPDNAGITAIQAKTDNLPALPAATGDIPTAIENAGAIRTELTTELAAIITMLKTLKNKREIRKVGATWTLFVYDDDGTTPILSKELKDVAAGEITDIAAGLLAQEVASSV